MTKQAIIIIPPQGDLHEIIHVKTIVFRKAKV